MIAWSGLISIESRALIEWSGLMSIESRASICIHPQVRLAEKDAQLMGGFGEMSRLRDLEDDLCIPAMIMMPRSRDVRIGRWNRAE
jgi:hypothetical protein